MFDRSLSLDEFSTPRIAILGGRSLAKYSTRILAEGFGALGWDVVPLEHAQFAIIQLHGAPQSRADDSEILALTYPELSGAAILVHRPDEILTHCPQVSSFVRSPSPPGPIVLLGDWHLNDTWLSESGRTVEIIPHGFYASRRSTKQKSIVVGSHTTWGEMRSLERALNLIVETFRAVSPGSVVGYLGGVSSPSNSDVPLSPEYVRQLTTRLSPDLDVAVTPSLEQVQNPWNRHCLVVNPGSVCPDELIPTFNLQIYHLGARVRTGESSGSLHEVPCIPVIAEMNGAEVIEDLKVVKVPYRDVSSAASLDLPAAARAIAEAVTSGSYRAMLKHNTTRAKALSASFIATSYARVLTSLAASRKES